MATIERRFDADSGFVYVNKTRMGFSPRSATYNVEPVDGEPLVLWRASRWPKPTDRDIAACLAELNRAYPDRVIELG